MRSNNKSKDKGRLILEAAVEVFSSKPFHQVKVEDVAAHAGVGKGTVYGYYSSKEELFSAIFEEGSKAYQQEVETALAEATSAADKIKALVTAHLEFTLEHRYISLLLISDQKIIVPREKSHLVIERRKRLQDLIQKIIEQGIAAQDFRPQDSFLAALMVMGALAALWSLVLAGEESRLENKEAVVTDFILRSLEAR